jgi:hypothetical protein
MFSLIAGAAQRAPPRRSKEHPDPVQLLRRRVAAASIDRDRRQQERALDILEALQVPISVI